MLHSRTNKPLPSSAAYSRGACSLYLILGVLTALGCLGGSFAIYVRATAKDTTSGLLMATAQRGPYQRVAVQRGEVESSRNIEIRCEVRASDASSGVATSIIDVIREGAQVEKGDWLVTFDASPLEQELSRQKIAVNTIEVTMIESKAIYETALISLDEYLKGTYIEQRKTIENEVFVAEDSLKQAQLAFDSIGRLVTRDLLTPLQLEGERSRVHSAKNVLDLAKQRLDALANYTKVKMVTQLESAIQSAEVTYRSASGSHQEEVKLLRDIEDQITKCVVTAPQAGQVVYANVKSRRVGGEFVVESGAPVRERQVILHLPDPNLMQVRATIRESRLNLIQEGMQVAIHFDAYRDLTLRGKVAKLNRYAEPGSFWSSSGREYLTLISIENPPPQIRAGMTAEVEILVEDRSQALTLPVQAIYERESRVFCIVQRGANFEIREVFIDSTDDEVVALDEARSDLEPEEQVVLHPRQHMNLIRELGEFASD